MYRELKIGPTYSGATTVRANSTREQQEWDEDVLAAETHKLILWNDDVNTFDHVIKCLMQICNHDAIQAEQCALIVHYKGKAIVKEGEIETLADMCTALLDKGLSATVD